MTRKAKNTSPTTYDVKVTPFDNNLNGETPQSILSGSNFGFGMAARLDVAGEGMHNQATIARA